MRDIIWTIIGIWVLWRIIEAFRSYSSHTKKTNGRTANYTDQDTTENTANNSQPKKGELKSNAGEYVDYEEIK